MQLRLRRAVIAALLLLCPHPPLRSQESTATIRVEVTGSAGPIEGARVTMNGVSTVTARDGVAVGSSPRGTLEITVLKDGYFPGKASLAVDEARVWSVLVELQPQEKVEGHITVHATRTDQRLEDTPLRVEILQEDEIAEKTMMTPGDIVMMLNETGGLRVQTTSPSLGAASVRIQGMRGRYTRFLGDVVELGLT